MSKLKRRVDALERTEHRSWPPYERIAHWFGVSVAEVRAHHERELQTPVEPPDPERYMRAFLEANQ